MIFCCKFYTLCHSGIFTFLEKNGLLIVYCLLDSLKGHYLDVDCLLELWVREKRRIVEAID